MMAEFECGAVRAHPLGASRRVNAVERPQMPTSFARVCTLASGSATDAAIVFGASSSALLPKRFRSKSRKCSVEALTTSTCSQIATWAGSRPRRLHFTAAPGQLGDI